MCEQEQLASDLDRALSLSQLSKLDSKPERSKGRSADGRAKELGVQPPAKVGKHKSLGSPPSSSSEAVRKVKGQKKNLFCSVRSELSSCSNSEYHKVQTTQSDVIWPICVVWELFLHLFLRAAPQGNDLYLFTSSFRNSLQNTYSSA